VTTTPSTWRLLAYGVTGFPLAALYLPVYIYLPTFYVQNYGLEIAAVGAALLFARLADAVSDPVIGILSDVTKSPIGRRKTWMVFGAPFTLLALYKLFVPPADPTVTYLFLWSIVLTVSWTSVILPYNAWGAELSDDYAGRTRVTAIREVFVIFGTLVAASAPAIATTATGGDLGTALWLVVILVGVTLPLSIIANLWWVPDTSKSNRIPRPNVETLRVIWQNVPFRRLLTGYFINSVANGLPATLFILFVTHRLGMENMAGPLLLLYFAAGLIAIPFWTFLARRIGKHNAWIGAIALSCFAFGWTPFVVGQGDLWPFMIITLVSGFGVGADLFLPSSIQADVIDVDRAASGESRTGLFFSIWGLATKVALALGVGIAFPILGAAGFDASAEQQSELAGMTLALLYAGLPVILKLGAVYWIWNFPLGEDELAQLRQSQAFSD